jgi:hypothetical protein
MRPASRGPNAITFSQACHGLCDDGRDGLIAHDAHELEAEVHRIAGNALKSPQSHTSVAEANFDRALAVACAASKVLGASGRNEHGTAMA